MNAMIITKYEPLLTSTDSIFTEVEFVWYKIPILISINPLQ